MISFENCIYGAPSLLLKQSYEGIQATQAAKSALKRKHSKTSKSVVFTPYEDPYKAYEKR